MTQEEFTRIEEYMKSQMKDSAHDKHHIYRVLNSALDILRFEQDVDENVLIAACLLHDIGREKQFGSLKKCHAKIGSKMAYEYLTSHNWSQEKALHVKECISSHRYRKNNPPQSIEAKILFDADKLDVCGAIGMARTLTYSGKISESLYILDEENKPVEEGGGAEISTFFQEYNYKLKKIYSSFHTERAKAIALERQKAAVSFYNDLYREVAESYTSGAVQLKNLLK